MPEQFDMILNLAFIAIILLAALMGLLRGMRKSIFQLIMSVIFLVLAVILIPPIAEALMDMNLEPYKQHLPSDIQGHVTTIKGTVVSLLQANLPDQQFLFEPGSETLEIIYGVIKLILVLILYLIYFVFSITILKLITLIVWLFVRPKGEYPKRRLIGAAIGGVRGVLAVCLLAIPLVGISSIYGAAKTVTSVSEQQGSGNPMAGMEEFDKYFMAYDNTFVGKTFDVSNADEAMFDYVFKIDVKVNGKTESIKIRNDIHHAAKIYEIVMNATEGQFDETMLFRFSDEDIEGIKKHLNKTNILKLVQVAGVEYLYGEIENRNLATGYEEYLTLENLKEIDLKEDLITIFTAIQIINEVDFTSDNIEEQVFSLERETVTELVDELAEIQLLEYILPMALNYVLNEPGLQDIITTYGINEEDIVKPSPEELINDIKNIKEVYLLLKDLDVNSLDDAGNLFKDGAFFELEDEELERMVGVVFDFELIDSNTQLLAAFGHNELEKQENLQGLISRDEFLQNFDEEEIKYVLKLVKVLVQSDVLSNDANFESLLTTDNIDKIADIMVNSKIISLFTPKVLEMVFDNFADIVELEVPEDVSYKDEEGKVEITALLNAVKVLYDNNFLESSFDPSTITHEQIEDIADKLSAAITIRHNITAIVQKLMNDQEASNITIASYERDHWSKNELLHTLMTFKLLSEYDLLTSEVDMTTLDDDRIRELASHMSSSVTISDNITQILDNVVSNLAYNEITIDYPSTHWTEDELFYTVKSFKLFNDYQMLDSSFDATTLTDEQIDELALNMSSSITIRDNITPILDKVVGNLEYTEITIDYPSEHWTKDELSNTVKAIKSIQDSGLLSSPFDISTLDDVKLDGLSEDLSLSLTIRDNITPIIKKVMANQSSGVVLPDYESDHWTKPEIYHTLRAFRIVTSDDILLDNNSDILANSMSRSVTVNSITKDLLEEAIADYNYEIEFVVLENEEYFGDQGETELRSLFTAIKTLNNNNMLGSGFSVANLEEENINTLSNDLSASKTVRTNINGIFNHIITAKGYDFVQPNYTEDHWDRDELYYTISALKVFDVNNLTSETIHTLPSEDISKISRSRTITDAFKSEIYRMNEDTPENTSSLKGKLVIPDGLVWVSTETNKGEVEHILLSIKEIQGLNNFSEYDPNIDALFGKDKTVFFESKILLHTFVDKHLRPLITDEDKLAKYFEPKDYYGNDYNWYGDENNDAIAFVEALDDLNTAGVYYNNMNFTVFKAALKENPNRPREINDAIVQSRIFTHSLTKMMKEFLYNQAGLPPALYPIHEGHPDEWGTPGHDGKLLELLQQIALLP